MRDEVDALGSADTCMQRSRELKRYMETWKQTTRHYNNSLFSNGQYRNLFTRCPREMSSSNNDISRLVVKMILADEAGL